jgi:hypothetical protein
MSELGQPTFYRYYEHQILQASLFDIHVDIYLLVFGPNIDDLSDPSVEPVGIYHQAGIRHYLWRDASWSETDWDRRHIKKRLVELLHKFTDEKEFTRLRRIDELIDLTFKCGAPSPTDSREPLNDPISQIIRNVFKISVGELVMNKAKRKQYCRAIYRI